MVWIAMGMGSWNCLSAQERTQGTPAVNFKSLQTAAEKSNYAVTANEKEVLDFLNALDAASPLASQIQIGSTLEGRPIQALVMAKEPVAILPLPDEDPRLVIVIIGGIHSGECDGKEALLALARDLLAGPAHPYLNDAVLIFIPNFNADGNERLGLLHRPGQEGPARGMGTRENTVALDLNRDFIKLETNEVRSLVRALDVWDADVLIDAHTTNGSLHQYDLTYDVPHNPASNPNVTKWLRSEMLPTITAELATRQLKTFYYGNFSRDHLRWESFGHEPRYSTEYMGLRGKIGILVESYSYASYQRRVEASYAFIDACLKQLTHNAARIQKWIQPNANANKSVPIQAQIVADSAPTIAKGYAWKKSNPGDSVPSGFPSPRDRNRLSEMTPTDYPVQLVNVGLATRSVDVPDSYFIAADHSWAAARLRMHGIRLAWLDAERASQMPQVRAAQYRIATLRELNEFQGHRSRKVEVVSEDIAWKPAAGWVVSTRQPLGTLATYLLEPHSDDSLAHWNFFDPSLREGSTYPVVKLFEQIHAPEQLKPLGLQDTPSRDMAREPLTLEKIYDPNQRIVPSTAPVSLPRWLPDGERYSVLHDGRWMSVDCATGAMQPFDRPRRMVDALSKLEAFKDGQASKFARNLDVFDPSFENAIVEHNGEHFLVRLGNDPSQDKATRLMRAQSGPIELVELSPTGKQAAFIQGQNLGVTDCITGDVQFLTQDGGGEILNGKLDWVYQEEIYGRGKFKGYWWSPDGAWIAYLRLDESPVPRFQIDNSLSYAQSLEETRYPKSGQPNPGVSLRVVHVATAKHHEVPLTDYAPNDRLVVRVGWHPYSSKQQLVYQVQNRVQSKLDVYHYDVESQQSTKWIQETSPAWVDVIDEPKWLRDGSCLWLSDAPSGRRHLFRIRADGNRVAVTQGDWDIKSVEAVSPDGDYAWLLARRSARVNTDLLRVELTTGMIETLGEPTGTHRVSVHPKTAYYFDHWSDATTPGRTWLHDAKGHKVRYVSGLQSDRLDYLQMATTELFEIKARDGFPMQALLYKPKNFSQRMQGDKMPVLIYVYGGPAAPSVENTWNRRSDLWHRFLAEHGICVLLCDNRSALGRGNADTWKIYKDLCSVELRDLEDAVAWLHQQSWVDPQRIGMWGWSYGGYFTSYAMTHSKLFRAGIAGAPVTDWNNYDSIYTERYMDTPQNNPSGYQSSSVVAAAGDLHGRLMLIHGEIDDNVHMANTLQLAHALQKAHKAFDLMIYPNNRHGIVDADQVFHQYQLMTNFFQQHLLGRENSK
jgi:dipeptidyl aminopeptidase/acylaminoacyl peptidase